MVSYGYIVIGSMLIGGTALYSFWLLPINGIFTAYNTFVSQGMVTQQNYDAMNFHRYILLAVPFVILLGVTAWGIVRSLRKKNEAI